jgi:hypothetical protein
VKAFIAGTLAAIVISVGAVFALESLGWSTGAKYTTENVRR